MPLLKSQRDSADRICEILENFGMEEIRINLRKAVVEKKEMHVNEPEDFEVWDLKLLKL